MWEYLIIGHSHGGNIATQATRQLMNQGEIDSNHCRVACMNTPFLKHEMRSNSAFLWVWALICFAMCLVLLWALSEQHIESVIVQFQRAFSRFGYLKLINVRSLTMLIGGFTIALLLLFLLRSRLLQTKREDEKWEPRPSVLCISTPDDEVNTLMGLADGIANLPQLLMHPIGLGALIVITFCQLWSNGTLSQLDSVPGLASAALVFAVWLSLWLTAALAGGLIGARIITVAFGLSAKQILETFVSRVIVSFVPLLPARAHFRALAGKASLLLHSEPYKDPKVADEICCWFAVHADK